MADYEFNMWLVTWVVDQELMILGIACRPVGSERRCCRALCSSLSAWVFPSAIICSIGVRFAAVTCSDELGCWHFIFLASHCPCRFLLPRLLSQLVIA